MSAFSGPKRVGRVKWMPFTHISVASVTVGKTTMRQSAGDTTTLSSAGEAIGRASGRSSRVCSALDDGEGEGGRRCGWVRRTVGQGGVLKGTLFTSSSATIVCVGMRRWSSRRSHSCSGMNWSRAKELPSCQYCMSAYQEVHACVEMCNKTHEDDRGLP